MDTEMQGLPPWRQAADADPVVAAAAADSEEDDAFWKEVGNISSPVAAMQAALPSVRVPESGGARNPDTIYSTPATPRDSGPVNPFAQQQSLYEAAQGHALPFGQSAATERTSEATSRSGAQSPQPGYSPTAGPGSGHEAGATQAAASLTRTGSGGADAARGSAQHKTPRPKSSLTPKKSGASKPPLPFKASPSPSKDEPRKVNFDSDQQFDTFIQRMERSCTMPETAAANHAAAAAAAEVPAAVRAKNGKYYSQPLTPVVGQSELMRRAISGFSEPVTPRGRGKGASAADAKAKAQDYKMFRTGSRTVERAQSASGRASRDGSVHGRSFSKVDPITEPELVTNVSAGRFFDALQGPEFEVLKDSEDLLLPLDQQWPFLLRFPISAFGISLGLGSQTILWKVLAASRSMDFLHIPKAINLCLWCLALLSLVFITITYVCKVTYYFEAVRREFYHPVRINFFFAPWIACMFLTIGVPPDISTHINPAVWCVFMAPIFALELKIYGQWLSGGDRRLSKVANPSTHLSVVGNFVGALLGAEVGWKEAATFFWAVGLAHYMVVFVTLYQRLPTNEALPKELHPVFFLFVAAPSVASVAWMKINNDFDNVSRFVYFIALFLFTSLAVRVNFFRGFRFSVAWWAYTFPMTAAAVATIQYSRFVTHPITQGMALALTVISSTIVLGLFVSTCFHAFVWGGLFPNDMAIAITCKKRRGKKKLKESDSTSSSDMGIDLGEAAKPVDGPVSDLDGNYKESPLGK